MKRILVQTILQIVTSLMCLTVLAQTPGPLEPSDTTSISSTLHSFLAACNELHEIADPDEPDSTREQLIPVSERILDCLDLSGLPEDLRDSSGLESGVYLKEVLDRIELPAEENLQPQSPTGEVDSNRWRVPGTRIAIERIQAGPHEGEFQFTSETVRRAAKLYSAVKSLPYRESGPQVSPSLHEHYLTLMKRQPTLSADTRSPRGTLTLFLNTANDIYQTTRSKQFAGRSDPRYLPMASTLLSCLDQSELPEYYRDYYSSEAAVCLKEVIDRVKLPPPEEIPGAEDLIGTDGGETLVRWQIPNTQLVIARITEGPRRGEFLFTSGTIERVLETYDKLKKQPYQTDREVSVGFYDWYLSQPADATVARLVDFLPGSFRNRVGSLAIWQWIGFTFLVVVSLLTMSIAYRLERVRSVRNHSKGVWRNWVTILFLVLGMLVPLVFLHIAREYLTLRGSALYVAEFGGNFAFLLALIVLILGVSKRLADAVVAMPRMKTQGLDATLTRILCRLAGIVAATVVFIEGGRYLGFPITTLLASAGIGGLAIALSAQGMIKGLFGTITILLDKPFRVGERIVVNGHDGFVEEIGLRSTKIRTFMTNHMVSIPNDQMADSEVENIGRRNHIQRKWDMHIPLDTPLEKVKLAIAMIREALAEHEGMDPELPPRIFFSEFNADSFNIQVHYWYHPPNLWEFQAFSEKINLKIFQLFEEHGIQFSLPSRHSFWKADDQQGPLDVRVETADHDSA